MKGAFLLSSFLVILSLALSQKLCPPPELIEPCECSGAHWPITYNCKSIAEKDTLIDAFNNTLGYPVHALAIDNAYLRNIPTALVKAKNVTFLLISHSAMYSVFDEPIGAPYVIQTFQIVRSSFLRGIEWEVFNGVSIGQIQIEKTDIMKIGASFVASVEPTVTEIIFDAANILSVHKNAFSKLTKLQTLSMSHNNIQALQRSMFPTPSNIRMLDLSWNKISKLPDDLFSNMPALTDVFLEGNKLKTFPARIWQKLIDSSLHQVTLADNPIVCDCGIKWYTTKRRSIRVTGKCAEPENLKNYNLIQLISGDFSYCPK